MLNIAIIGCGQIGSRHLQGLSRLNESAVIYLVDNLAKSIEVAKERFNEVVNKDKIDQFEIKVRNIAEIEDDIDVAIIATSSLNRAQITKELVLYNKVKYIVFEKFLFQKRTDYDEIRPLLERNNIKSWVNQWMCFTDAFQEIIEWVGGAKIEILVSGNGFGLGCNAVHFIDILDYASSREKNFEKITKRLDSKVIKSKREGFYEVHGEIEVVSGGSKLSIISLNNKADGVINFTFSCGERHISAKFTMGTLKSEFYEFGKHKFNKDYSVPPQSKMSDKLILDIVSTGKCNLPNYDRSALHHKIIIDLLDDHIRDNSDWIGEGCPIT
jgi:threonine dehydrogenase-like Zn-dependent dehydrogenase